MYDKKASDKAYRESHKIQIAEIKRRWYLRNKMRLKPSKDAWRRANTQKSQGYKIQCRYGLKPQDIENLWSFQQGKCAICSVPMLKRGLSSNSMVVDHDHNTNKARELLCRQCNSAIGYFGEDIHTMKSAIAYIEKHAMAKVWPS